MTKFVWNGPPAAWFGPGIDRGVFFPKDSAPETWDGLISVNEAETVDSSVIYIDGMKVGNRNRFNDLVLTLEAYTYPLALDDNPESFALSYRSRISEDHYQIHLIYNVKAKANAVTHTAVNDSPEPILFGWDLSTLAIDFAEGAITSHVIIDTRFTRLEALAEVEEVLYGTDLVDPHLPTPEELIEIFESNAILRVVDHGDGTYTVTGPDEAIVDNGDGTFTITWPSAINTTPDYFQISSL